MTLFGYVALEVGLHRSGYDNRCPLSKDGKESLEAFLEKKKTCFHYLN